MKTSTEPQKYVRDVIVRITGDDKENVYWEAALLESYVKPMLTGNTFSFVLPTDVMALIEKKKEKEADDHAAAV